MKRLGPGDITVHRNDGIVVPDGGNFWDGGNDVDDNDYWDPGWGDGDDDEV